MSLSDQDVLRICRDLAFSEIAAMPGVCARLGERVAAQQDAAPLDWSANGLALDSLARMQLATAAAVWCNAYDAGFEDLFLAKRNAADWARVMQRARQAGARNMTFSSSGSTGVRKHIRHQESHLADEAQAWAEFLRRSVVPVRRIVMLAPTHHIYGLIWGVLLPAALQVPVIDARVSDLPTLHSGDVIVAVPDQWAWLAKSHDPQQHDHQSNHQSRQPTPAVRAWPQGVMGISSTAPMPAAVHTALTSADTHGGAALSRLLQIYGSTETAGVAWRDTPEGDYTLAPGRVRTAADGIERLLPGGQTITLAVQDDIRWTSATTFELLRRSDHSVQVGGHNISPAWVTEQLRNYSAVLDASVRLDATAQPPRLKAFVVLNAPADVAQQAAFEAWAADTLPWYAGFSSVCYGIELPRNAMGKPCDWPPPPSTHLSVASAS